MEQPNMRPGPNMYLFWSSTYPDHTHYYCGSRVFMVEDSVDKLVDLRSESYGLLEGKLSLVNRLALDVGDINT